jgi:hypothetical protein
MRSHLYILFYIRVLVGGVGIHVPFVIIVHIHDAVVKVDIISHLAEHHAALAKDIARGERG